jgi:hypothetical protein
VDEVRVHPETLAGDLFHAAPRPDHDHQEPHVCNEGIVFIGHMVEGEDGEEVEYAAYPRRRCAEARKDG